MIAALTRWLCCSRNHHAPLHQMWLADPATMLPRDVCRHCDRPITVESEYALRHAALPRWIEARP